MADDPFLLLALGGVLVFSVGVWLRRQQGRFEQGLRANGDPLVEHPGTKAYRQRFQAWLFGLEGQPGPAPGRALLSLVFLGLIIAAAAWSLLPGLFGGAVLP
ncbi:MAG: hypothetical protein AAGI34_00475 [Pseudomonadota bacterium]